MKRLLVALLVVGVGCSGSGEQAGDSPNSVCEQATDEALVAISTALRRFDVDPAAADAPETIALFEGVTDSIAARCNLPGGIEAQSKILVALANPDASLGVVGRQVAENILRAACTKALADAREAGYELTVGGRAACIGTETSAPAPAPTTTAWDPLSTEPVVTAPDVSMVDVSDPSKTTLDRTLGTGMAGVDVKRVQQRLIDLGFDPGDADGIFGDKSVTAVWAYEKLVLGIDPAQVTGKVTPKMWLGMQDDIVIEPKRTKTTRTHMEIYLPSQVAILFVEGVPRLITHISSGSGEEWDEVVTIDPGEEGNESGTEQVQQRVRATSITPGGVYQFYKREASASDGWREGRYGRMYKPVYFNFGLAVYGSTEVPNAPSSHGGVRIPLHIADYFPDLVKNGDRVFVFDGKKSPEYYGAQHPVYEVTDVGPNGP